MDKILQMKQKRAALIQKMRKMVADAESAQRSLNTEEKSSYEQLRDQASDLADDIVREEELRELESKLPAPGVTASGSRDEKLEPGIRAARFVKVALLSARSHQP